MKCTFFYLLHHYPVILLSSYSLFILCLRSSKKSDVDLNKANIIFISCTVCVYLDLIMIPLFYTKSVVYN